MERKVCDDLQTIIVNLSKIKKMTAKAQAEILKPYGISSGHAAYVMALYGGGSIFTNRDFYVLQPCQKDTALPDPLFG